MTYALTTVACQWAVIPYHSTISTVLSSIFQLYSIYTTTIFNRCGLAASIAAGSTTFYTLNAQAVEATIAAYSDTSNLYSVTGSTAAPAGGKSKGGGGRGSRHVHITCCEISRDEGYHLSMGVAANRSICFFVLLSYSAWKH
jgi:hypothetical protein